MVEGGIEESGHVDGDDVLREVRDEVCARRTIYEELNLVTPLAPRLHDFLVSLRPVHSTLDLIFFQFLENIGMSFWICMRPC